MLQRKLTVRATDLDVAAVSFGAGVDITSITPSTERMISVKDWAKVNGVSNEPAGSFLSVTNWRAYPAHSSIRISAGE